MTRKIFCIALVAISASAPAVAESGAGARVTSISLAGLDLGTPSGLATLDRRAEAAIQRVCGGAYPLELQGRDAVRRCRAVARADYGRQRSALLASRGVSSEIAVAVR
jgi:UrcA family protein